MTLLSFCIPTYNRSSLIKKNLDSIIGYKGLEIEVVVVDDCSPDQTEQEINAIKDKRIRYFRNTKNINAVLNIYKSITLAKGEWVFTRYAYTSNG